MSLAQNIKREKRNKKAQAQRKLKKLGFKPCEISEICVTLGILEEINFSL